MRVMATAGRINARLPDVDVDTARVGNRLSSLPASARSRVLRNVEDLSDGTKRYLAETDVANPGTKTAKLVEYSGSAGRRALDALAGTNRRAADALLRLSDDVATQRAMVRAWARHDIDTDELRKGLRRYDELDADQKRFARQSLAEGDASTLRLLTQDACDSPCNIFDAADRIGDAEDLTDAERQEFLRAIRVGNSEVDVGPGDAGGGDVVSTVESLSDDGVNGVDDLAANWGGTYKSGYGQIAGESDITRTVLDGDNAVGSSDVTVSRQVKDVPASAPKQSTEIDVDVEGEITVNGRSLDSPAIESKHLDPASRNDFVAKQEFRDLRDKLQTQAAAGEGPLVVVTTRQFRDAYRDRFDNLEEAVRSHSAVSSDTTVEVTTYQDLNP